MIKGLYTSALGMTVQMQRLDVVTNNIANVNTTGFKRDETIIQSFSEELAKRVNSNESTIARMVGRDTLGGYSQGLFVDDIYTDFSAGSLSNTGGALDVAISGDGFFTVRNPATGQDVYTRNGSFTVDSDRMLVTKEGYQVIGENGPIVVPDGSISINQDGGIYVDAEYVSALSIVNYEDLSVLRKQGDGFYTAIEEGVEAPFTGTVEQGFLEGSNVNSVKEMIEMINLTRAYEANQRMITAHDTLLNRAVNDIAKK